MSKPTINHAARCEARLRRHLTKHGRSRESYVYHIAAGPHYVISREQFEEVVLKLAEEGFLERLEGVDQKCFWVVLRAQVDATIRSGVLDASPTTPLRPESC